MKYKNILLAFLFPVVVQGSTSLKDAVEDTLLNNPDILSYQKNNKATRTYVDEAKGAFLPTLDFEWKYQSEKTEEEENNSEDTQKGPAVSLTLNQNIYDGNLNYNTLLEKRHNYKKVFLENKKKIEDVILEATSAYLDLKQAEDIMFLSNENIIEHERILTIAKENEEISGEAIDRLQAESKLYTAYNDLKKHEKNKKQALSEYKKIIGNNPKEDVCKPIAFKELLPKSLNEAIINSLQKNLEIKAGLEGIYEQRAIYSQEKSRFLPKIKASLKYEKDENITTDNVTSTVYTSTITLSYNLFNGNQDLRSYEREKIFLFESQKKLDSTTQSVEDSVKQAYNSYVIAEEKIENLKKYTQIKKEILSIYQDQFEGGTVSILDLLGEASELYRARQELIQEEIQQLKNYYTILALYGNLSDVILDNSKQLCSDEKLEGLFEFAKKDETLELDAELEGLLGEDTLGAEDEISLDEENLLDDANNENLNEFEQGEIEGAKTNDEVVDEMLEKLLAEAYKNQEKDYLIVDDGSAGIKPRVIGDESFKETFLKAPAHFYTINVIAFGSMDKASEFIKKNEMMNNSFAFQYGKDLKLFKVVYGVFEKYEDAKDRLVMLSFPEKYYPIIEKVGKKQELYKKYNIGYEAPQEDLSGSNDNLFEEEMPKLIEYPPLVNNEVFKENFLESKDESFTINLYTFIDADAAQNFISKNKLENKSLLFRFGKNKKLIKLVYGIYPSIDEANKDLKTLRAIDENIYPVVEKIKKQKDIFKKFNDKDSSNLEVINETSSLSENLSNNKFLASPEDNYTINIATITSEQKAKTFVDRYNLSDEAVVYQFGNEKKYSKILYGVYSSYEEAVSAMGTLDSNILANKPHVEKIKKHQELYKKYNEE